MRRYPLRVARIRKIVYNGAMAKTDDYEEEYTEEYTEDYDEQADYEEDRRIFRHRRRVRNQIIVILVAVIFVLGIAAGCVFGIGKVAALLNEYRQTSEEIVEDTGSEQEETQEEEKVTVEAPMSVEEE